MQNDSTLRYNIKHTQHKTTTTNTRNTNMMTYYVRRPSYLISIAVLALLFESIVSLFICVTGESQRHAALKWKAPNADTPQKQVDEWHAEDAALYDYIEASVPSVLDHTGSEAFDQHLRGVQSILRYWGAPPHLYNAGLFHSICELPF